ncbi:hypothetical protein ASPBRDRAFT_109870, partial [Aspergillus brasiliensis CBS 101740]
LHLDPEDLPKFWAAFELTYKAVTAEPEITFFELYQTPDSPGAISWVDNYCIYRDYFTATETLFITPREAKLLNRLGTPFTMFKKTNGGLVD